MAFDAAWLALPAAARQVLVDAEATDAYAIAHLARANDTVGQVWNELGGQELHLGAFSDLRDLAIRHCRKKARQDAGVSDEQHVVRRELLDRQREMERVERFFLSRGLATGDVGVTPMLTRPTRCRSTLRPGGRAAGSNQPASEREQQYRDKYVKEIIDLLISVRAPTALSAAQCGDVRATLALIAAGRRASTLRCRLRAWKAFLRWLAAAYDESWPSSWRRLLEYLQMRAAEPCGRQSILGFAYAAAFWERASGCPLTVDTLWRPAVQELLARVASRARGGASQSAVPTLAKHLAALELIAVAGDEPRWLRGYATWKLMQAWGVLRFDDHRGISQEAAHFERHEGQAHLKIVLTRTKTTGRGKRVERREVAISAGAYLLESSWLEVGWAELVAAAPHPRDYLLSPPERGMRWAKPKELTYQEAAGWSRALYTKMGEAMGLQESTASLIGQAFTEHSGRSFLPSAAMAMGASDDFVKPLGGWSATSTRGYMKSALRRMTQVQDVVAAAMRAHWGEADVIGESAHVRQVINHLIDHGIEREAANVQTALVRAFKDRAPEVSGVWADSFKETEHRGGPEDSTTATGSSTPIPPTGASDTLPLGERGYVVSISMKHRLRRLHYLGRCHRVPGVHYQEYEFLGGDRPGEDAYDDYCRQCWRDPEAAAAAVNQAGYSQTDEMASDPERSEETEDHSSSTDVDDMTG
jgi:hypothetical protein